MDKLDMRWLPVVGFSDYEVSDTGLVRRCKPDWQGKYVGRVLSPAMIRGRYHYVTLCRDGLKKTRPVHQLVCEAFNGPRPHDTMHCAHRNGVSTNNTPDNLYWATPKQNADDRETHGKTHRGPLPNRRRPEFAWQKLRPDLVPKGERHWRTGTKGLGAKGAQMGAAKLTDEQVTAIFQAPQYHGIGKALSDTYGVSMALIGQIRKGKVWTHVTQDLASGRALLSGDG